jgi:hypothetical protein
MMRVSRGSCDDILSFLFPNQGRYIAVIEKVMKIKNSLSISINSREFVDFLKNYQQTPTCSRLLLIVFVTSDNFIIVYNT